MLIIAIITVAMCSGFLLATDPLGVYANHASQALYSRQIVPHDTGYRVQAGSHELVGWALTVNADGTRFTPASNPLAPCTVAFLGDSFTMGFAVDDSETYVNQLARRIDMNALNTGRNGYSAVNARLARDYYMADAYVYLHVFNDGDAPIMIDAPLAEDAPLPNFFTLYIDELRKYPAAFDWRYSAQTTSGYNEALDSLIDDDRVQAFAFYDTIYAGVGTTLSQQRETVILLDDYYQDYPVSATDKHPNAIGHSLIAAAIQPHLEAHITTHCN